MRYKTRKPKSVSAEVLIRKVQQFLSDSVSEINVVKESPTRVTIGFNPRLKNEYDPYELTTFVHRLGWFVEDESNWGIVFESYDAPSIIPEKYVYHGTATKNIKNILEKGLIPRHVMGYSDPTFSKRDARIYVTPHIDTILNDPVFDADRVGIIEINTEKLERGVIFHPDPHDEIFMGYWTTSYIPPEALKYLGIVEDLRDIYWGKVDSEEELW